MVLAARTERGGKTVLKSQGDVEREIKPILKPQGDAKASTPGAERILGTERGTKRPASQSVKVDAKSVAANMLKESGWDLALVGLPADWGEKELCVLFVPLGCLHRLQLRSAPSGLRVCLVRLRDDADADAVVKRIRTSLLVAEGLHVVNASSAQDIAPAPSPQKVPEFKIDQRLKLQKLKSQTELNGEMCTVVRYDDETGHWLVKLDTAGPDNSILVPPGNLVSQEGGGNADSLRPQRILYVAGLPGEWTQQKTEEYFARHGELRCVRLANRVKNGLRSTLIAFKRPQNAKNAFQRVNGIEVEGNILKCELRADPQRSGSASGASI
eukprot:TRINITY_DN111613_c0_g1_i1.p1 TRINITY_DN111613_c0_g1~~TRINITY_DN111613_c0_g1_i1.p1  ORF type:complete len:327 (-),score=63.98 TRINITY_DN111613_c0_g1_i1:16-996(-)